MEEDKKRINENETVIVDQQKRIIDIDIILNEKKDESIVNKINNLISCGSEYARKDGIKELFERKAGNAVNEENALEILEAVFNELVNDVNNHDEFIAIDPKTGEKDIAKSEEKTRYAIEYAPNKSEIAEMLDRSIGRYIEEDAKNTETVGVFESEKILRQKADAMKKGLDELFGDDNEESKDEDKKVHDIKITPRIVGKEADEIYSQAIKRIASCDEVEIQFLKLLREYSDESGKAGAGEIIKKINKYQKEYPEVTNKYIEAEKIDKRLNVKMKEEPFNKGLKKLATYEDDLVTVEAVNALAHINLRKEDLNQHILRLLAGLKIDELKNIVSEKLEESIPGYKHLENNIDSKSNCEAIEKFIGSENIKLDGKKEYYLFLDELCKRVVAKTDPKEIVKNQRKITDEELENSKALNVEEIDFDHKETAEEKYFKQSKIKFDNSDADIFQDIYRKASILSWIDNKDTALKRKYMCLQYTKEELEKSSLPLEIVEGKIEQINKEIETFEKNNPEFDFEMYLDEDRKLKDKYKITLRVFPELRGISKLTRDFVKDEKNINSPKAYSNLSDSEKEKYLRNTISALNQKDIPAKSEIKNQDVQSILEKFGQRRLEIISNENSPFLTDKNGIKVNEDVLLNAYNQVSPIQFNSYKDLVEYCELTRLEYANEKLKYCEVLDESSFQKRYEEGREKESVEEILKRIEQYKIANWNKAKFYINSKEAIIGESSAEAIDKLVLDSDLKTRITELDEKIGQEDVIMMEFLRLHIKTELTSKTERKNAIIERDSFINQHPDKAKEFLAYLNSDNKNEIDKKFESHNNVIAEKNTLFVIGTINSFSSQNLKDLINNEALKQQYLLTLVAGLDGMVEDRHEEVLQAIEKICPNTNFRDKEGKLDEDMEKFSQLIGNELGIENCNVEKLMSLMYSTKAIIVKNENVRRMENSNEIDFENLNVALSDENVSKIIEDSQTADLSENIKRDTESNYFKNSKMTYSLQDSKNFEKLYFESLSVSWIERKEEVEKLYYTSLLLKKENFKGDEKRTELISTRIADFEKKHPNINKEDFLENGNVKEEYKKDYQRYKYMKYTGDLIGDYVMDEGKVETLRDYEKMSKPEKKEYLEKTFLGLIEENTDNDIINKLAKRRLEIISKPKRNFIRENGNDIEIDKEALYKELNKYYKLSSKNINNLDELKSLYSQRKNNLVNTRLQEYCELSDDKFVELAGQDHESRAIKIEEMREKNKVKRNLQSILAYRNKKNRGDIQKSLESTSEKIIILGQEVIQSNKESQPKNAPKGIENSEMKAVNNYEKDLDYSNEAQKVEESTSNNLNVEKTSLLNRVKNMISNFTKSQAENSNSIDKEDVVNEENTLLPVESNKSLFSNITDKIRSFFYKREKNASKNEELSTQNEVEEQNDFNKRIQCDGKIENALKITRENAEKKNRSEGLENEEVQSDYDDRVGV